MFLFFVGDLKVLNVNCVFLCMNKLFQKATSYAFKIMAELIIWMIGAAGSMVLTSGNDLLVKGFVVYGAWRFWIHFDIVLYCPRWIAPLCMHSMNRANILSSINYRIKRWLFDLGPIWNYLYEGLLSLWCGSGNRKGTERVKEHHDAYESLR